MVVAAICRAGTQLATNTTGGVSDYTTQRISAAEAGDRVTLEKIGARIGYGRSMQILADAWRASLRSRYGVDDAVGTSANPELRNVIAECIALMKKDDTTPEADHA